MSESFIRTNTSVFGGGYYSHGKQFIERIPVPIPSDAQLREIDGLVEELILVLGEADAARMPHVRVAKEREAATLRSDIEACVSSVYGLSEVDVEAVRAVPIPE